MHGIRQIYAWVEIWVNGDCREILRVGQDGNEKAVWNIARRKFFNATGFEARVLY